MSNTQCDVSPNSVCPLPCNSCLLPVTDRQKIIEGDMADGLTITHTHKHRTFYSRIVRIFRIHFRFEVSLSPSPHLDISNISFELYFTLELQQQPSILAVER